MNFEFRHLSRRAFLLSTGAAGVAIGFGSLLNVRKAFGQAAPYSPNGWVRVGTDNVVTVYAPACEMGQGVYTAMPLLIAEEMDLDWNRVRIEQAPYNPKVFGNPLFGGAMLAGASRTTRGYYTIMRLAGMQGRAIMVDNAAKKWGVPAAECSTEPSAVLHKASGRRMSYGEIAAFAEVPASPPNFTPEQLKPMSQFRLIGKDVSRVEIPDKVSGQARYGIDVRMPGMMYAAVLRAPVNGERPIQVNDAEAKKVAGVKHVVPLPYGVGVVADTYPAAQKGKQALKVEWSQASKARSYTTDKVLPEYVQRVRNLDDKGTVYEAHGDAQGAIDKAAKRISAEYTSLNVTHATMFASTALTHASRSQSRKSPGGGPPALFTRMSGAGAALSAASRPCGVVMSPATAVTLTPNFFLNSSAVASNASLPRAVMTRCTPSRASDSAQPLPRPFDAAHTSAVLPRIPRSIL